MDYIVDILSTSFSVAAALVIVLVIAFLGKYYFVKLLSIFNNFSSVFES